MYVSILGQHLVGFTIFIAFMLPAHYKGLGIGVSVLAYTLGLRHAFDADHIAVIDNTTRKECQDRHGQALEWFGTVPGALISAGFLFLIGSLNLVILAVPGRRAGPVHRRDGGHGHHGRHLHEPGLRLGLLQPSQEGLLEPLCRY